MTAARTARTTRWGTNGNAAAPGKYSPSGGSATTIVLTIVCNAFSSKTAQTVWIIISSFVCSVKLHLSRSLPLAGMCIRPIRFLKI